MSDANSVSDLERAEHSSAVLAKRVSSVNITGTQVNPATEETLTAFKNKLPLIAFGDLRTAELSPIFQGSFEYTDVFSTCREERQDK